MAESPIPSQIAVLQPAASEPPNPRVWAAQIPPDGVIDPQTFGVIEVDALYDSVNLAVTVAGQSTLYRSLTRPGSEPPLVRAKQAAVTEIGANQALRQGLELLLETSKSKEKDFFDLLFGTFMGMVSSPAHPLEIEGYGYTSYIRGTEFLMDLVRSADQLPVAHSGYLQGLIDQLKRFAGSRAYALAQGPAYRTERGMISKTEKTWYIPAIRFRPSMFKPVGLALALVAILLLAEFVPIVFGMFGSLGPAFWLFLLPLGLLYFPIVGAFDRDGCIYPLREIFKKSPDVQAAVEALGQLDELLSFVRLKESFGSAMTLPQVVDGKSHAFTAKGLRNLVLGKQNPAYVPNDIDLGMQRLTFVTGPNSGGKTAFCKTLAQAQLLAQIGCYIPAESAELTVADRIFYQVPELSHLADGEGRFGTELRRTKDIFLATSARSLVIMDELSEGTTHEEKIEISTSILDGFAEKGSSTILITHNHELVDRYQQKGVGLALQVEFRNEAPTYRLVAGVSRVSHADRVARKIGFSRDDILKYLTGRS